MPTYPAAPPTLVNDVESISRFLRSPALVARRLRTLAEQRFISDAILTGRLPVDGGAVEYETGESIYSDRSPSAINAGQEYPLTPVSDGQASIAAVRKWGQDTLVTDEAIKRRRMDPVNKAMTKMVNQVVKQVDSLSLSAIATAVTQTRAATASWSTATAQQIINDILQARATVMALNEGYEPDTVVVDDARWAFAMSAFIATGLTPREAADTPLLTGESPVILGMRWLATPNLPTAGQALILDSTQLGGMADETALSPGYVSQDGIGIEGKVIREENVDGYRMRARRVTVPVVQNPAAAHKITGV